jgi:hypothetical protein
MFSLLLLFLPLFLQLLLLLLWFQDFNALDFGIAEEAALAIHQLARDATTNRFSSAPPINLLRLS